MPSPEKVRQATRTVRTLDRREDNDVESLISTFAIQLQGGLHQQDRRIGVSERNLLRIGAAVAEQGETIVALQRQVKLLERRLSQAGI